MFNLLVKATGWGMGRDRIEKARAFKYTDQHLIDRFASGGDLDIGALSRLPTLFVEESSGLGNETARIGTINYVKSDGRYFAIEYTYDQTMPPITNTLLERLDGELEIDRFEFHHTHWAIKDVDLFQVLFRRLHLNRRRPKVFHLTEPETIESNLVSVMMPFHPAFNAVYAAIRTAAQSMDLDCNRADDIWQHPAVVQDVVSLIERSRVVICDCSGRNPNVFYEMGISHTIGREVILITQSEGDVPFDLQHLRYIKYLNNNEGLAVLVDRIKQRLSDLANL